jgi:hypothetical protein
MAIERELTRREALLESLLNPHPETVDSGRAALGHFDLSDESDLVNSSAGTARALDQRPRLGIGYRLTAASFGVFCTRATQLDAVMQ